MQFDNALDTIADDQKAHPKQQIDINLQRADTYKFELKLQILKKKFKLKANMIRSADTTVIVGSDPGIPNEASS